MQQWVAEVAYDTAYGPRKAVESFYMPSVDDVRNEISKKGGYPLRIRPHERSAMERLLARSNWWQVQLLRGIQFRSTSASPGVAFWRIIQAETNPKRQNILAPAREALARGLGVIDALKALRIFDHGTIAILAASERANKLQEGIPHAIHSITQKRKNTRAIAGTMAWLGFDVISIVQVLFWGKGMVLKWFLQNAPKSGDRERYLHVVHNLELGWNVLIAIAFGFGLLMAWCIFSFWINRGKTDWPTARLVRRLPLIGAYLRDLGFADSMMAAARMLRSQVQIDECLKQSSEATTVPEVAAYWKESSHDLERGVMLGAALDRAPLTRAERLELASLSDLGQVATVLESIAEMRSGAAKTKHSLIVWLAFLLTGVFLIVAFGSAIYALTVMNMSLDSMMGDMMSGATGGAL
jgi:type II secretory pathway component PulF